MSSLDIGDNISSLMKKIAEEEDEEKDSKERNDECENEEAEAMTEEDGDLKGNYIIQQILIICCLGFSMMKKRPIMKLNKRILMMWMIMSKKVLASMEEKFSTGITELGNRKISDENEVFDFIIPFDLNH